MRLANAMLAELAELPDLNNEESCIRVGDTGWEIYVPEYEALFGTAWFPLPLTWFAPRSVAIAALRKHRAGA